jgi:hypothetical protein
MFIQSDILLFLVDQVRKRIKSLRTQFGKLRKQKPSGTNTKPLTTKNKWILERFQFLAPHMGVRPTTSNLKLIYVNNDFIVNQNITISHAKA